MARTTCTGLTPMDLGILAKDAVCHVCGKGGYIATDCWYQAGKESEKGPKPKDSDNKKNGAWDNASKLVTMRGIVRRRKSQARKVSPAEVICTA